MIKKLLLSLLLSLSLISNCWATLIDSYPESNYNNDINLCGAVGFQSKGGEALTIGSNLVGSVKFYLTKIGSPTGNATAYLYAATGTVGTNATPTGSALATSATLDVSTISGNPTYNLYEFTFTTPYNASAGDYCVFVEYTGGNSSNYVNMGMDSSSPTHSGNLIRVDNPDVNTWLGIGIYDTIFYLYSNSYNITSDKIELQLVRSGSPSDNTILRVETDNAGVPSGTLIDANATVTVASSGISTSYEWVTFTFPASITIPLGTTYWITLGRDGTRSTVNRIMWVSGTEAFSYAMAIQGSGTWDTASYTGYFCDFRVYGDVVTASTPSMQVIYIQ